jgi:hypothetical protein
LHLGRTLRYPDEAEYLALARNLVAQRVYSADGVHPTAYRLPGYPAILAALMLLKADLAALRFLNFVLLGLSGYLVWRLLGRASALAGMIGLAMAVGYPLGVYTAGTFYPQTLATTLFLAVLCLVFRREEPERGAMAAAGVLSGWLILTVATFAPIVLLLCAWRLAGGPARRWKPVLFLAGGCALVVTAWTLRNAAVFRSFVPVSTNRGISLLVGNTENTTPNAGVTVDISKYERAAEGMGEAEKDRYYAQCAREYVLSHKARALKLYVLKSLNYYNFRNTMLVKSESSPVRDLTMLVSYGLLLGLCIGRLLACRRFPLSALERFALAIYVLNGFLAAVFFTRLRFRLPFDYLLILVAASFAGQWLDERRRQGGMCVRTVTQRPTRPEASPFGPCPG